VTAARWPLGAATAPVIPTMPHQTLDHLFTCLGFVIWGDLGPTTIYRNKQGKVTFFEKTWPHKPPSPAQIIQRAKFIEAARAWQALTATTHRQWDLATRRASLCAHGYDLFIHWHTTGDTAAIRTLEHQTRTTLLPT